MKTKRELKPMTDEEYIAEIAKMLRKTKEPLAVQTVYAIVERMTRKKS